MAKKKVPVKASGAKNAKKAKAGKPVAKTKPKSPKPKQKPARRAPAPRHVEPKREQLTGQLLKAIDEMQDIAPGTIADVKDAPQSLNSRTPWRMVVRFVLPSGSSYDDILVVLRDWRDDRRIEKLIGSDRLSRIQVRYKGKGDRSASEYTLSEIGPWELAISRAVERVGVRDDRLASLIERYGQDGDNGQSRIESLIVWFSPFTSKEIKIGRQERAKAKADKSRRRA